ncbi:MAG: hypothetical protein R2737_09425 [Candidatus Nanopelagicales bacterium]
MDPASTPQSAAHPTRRRRVAAASTAGGLALALSLSTMGALAWAGAAQASGPVPRADGSTSTTGSGEPAGVTTSGTASGDTSSGTPIDGTTGTPTDTASPSGTSASPTPTSTPTRRYTLTLSVSSNTARVGSPVRLRLVVKPAAAAVGKRALLQQRTAKGRWQDAGTIKIGAKGVGTRKLRSGAPALVYFRALMPRDDQALKGASKLTWVVWYRG